MHTFSICLFHAAIRWTQHPVTKQISLKIDGAASSGHQGKLAYFIYFPLPPFEAELSILMY